MEKDEDEDEDDDKKRSMKKASLSGIGKAKPFFQIQFMKLHMC
ncbi:hypothetical protein Lalb_Chr13g0296911 [Lupinus albus]|uniref:Uncharacterized protein n=1 Tax=Lupinus albus TaxID=3870 RepID=A0A6A4PIS8_LUPAL|nr:hypothetical protein Lalb_Chr13g0296911 [Lupinus albus]